MNRRCLTLALAATLATPTAAWAQQIICGNNTLDLSFIAAPGRLAVTPQLALPTVNVCVNGSLFPILGVVQRGNLAFLPTTIVNLGNGASFNVSASFDGDPFSNFTFGSVLPAGFGPLNFDVYFTTAVVPGAYTTATSSGTLGVTATSASNTAPATTGIVSQGTYPSYISGYGDATNLGVDTGMGTCSITTTTSASTSCNPPGAANTFAPISPAFLTAYLSYSHNTTGSGSSTVGWTGGVTLNEAVTTTPEPATVALMASGLVAVAGAARLRRRG